MSAVRYKIAQWVALVYRLSLLRLARIVFRNAKQGTILSRKFYHQRLFLDVSRSSGNQLLWLEGKRYIKEKALLEQIVRPHMTVLDVGANIGYYALMFVSLLEGKGHVICLEPDPNNLDELRRNVANNRLDHTVTIMPVAAGEFDGSVRFAAGSNGRVASDGSLTVSVVRIDSLMIKKLDVLKIDVEGYEASVLKGAQETLERDRPAIFLELHPTLLTPDAHEDIIAFLRTRYTTVTAFCPDRGTILKRILRDYSLLPCFSEIEDICTLPQAFKTGRITRPCWVVAQS
jgi:FkbM family methyltransferase